jgi:hypothetical protein
VSDVGCVAAYRAACFGRTNGNDGGNETGFETAGRASNFAVQNTVFGFFVLP